MIRIVFNSDNRRIDCLLGAGSATKYYFNQFYLIVEANCISVGVLVVNSWDSSNQQELGFLKSTRIRDKPQSI